MAKYKQYKLTNWSKKAKIAMIEKNIQISDLIRETGYSQQHLVSVINGRVISDTAINKISECLGISNKHD